jgi:hypothetical protein
VRDRGLKPDRQQRNPIDLANGIREPQTNARTDQNEKPKLVQNQGGTLYKENHRGDNMKTAGSENHIQKNPYQLGLQDSHEDQKPDLAVGQNQDRKN